MSQVFDLSSGAEFADVFFGGFGRNVKALGDGEICAVHNKKRESTGELSSVDVHNLVMTSSERV